MTPPLSPRILGLMILATTSIVIGDTAGKLMTSNGISPFFVAWTRFALAAVLLAPLSGVRRAELPGLLDRRVILRAVLIICGISSILTALRSEPIANVFGGFFIGPVVAFALSVLILRERITRNRSLLLLAGFAGVMMVVQPGLDMGPGMGFALLAGCFYGSFLIATRIAAPHYRPRFLLLSQLLIGAIVLAAPGIAQAPAAISAGLAGLVLTSALASALGNLLIVVVSRHTPASVTAPLVYFQLIAATGLGYLVFGDWPDRVSLTGLAIILASGLGGFALARRG